MNEAVYKRRQTFIRHVRVSYDPLSGKEIACQRRAAFWDIEGRQPLETETYWTDHRGYVQPFTVGDVLSRTKHEPVPFSKNRVDDRPATGPLMLEGHKWWARRHAILHVDGESSSLGIEKFAELNRDWTQARVQRALESVNAVLAGINVAPEVEPVVVPEPEKPKRAKIGLDFARAKKRRELARMWLYMSGQAQELLAKKEKFMAKKASLAAELEGWAAKQQVARAWHNSAKDAGFGGLVYTDDGPAPEFGDDGLARYRKLKAEINLEVSFIRDEIKEIDIGIADIDRRLNNPEKHNG
jgi:hypothetical protein